MPDWGPGFRKGTDSPECVKHGADFIGSGIGEGDVGVSYCLACSEEKGELLEEGRRQLDGMRSGPRTLLCTIGRLHFAWTVTSADIEVYSLTEGNKPLRRVGMLNARDEGGELIDFMREPFEAHCNWFIEIAGTAEIRD